MRTSNLLITLAMIATNASAFTATLHDSLEHLYPDTDPASGAATLTVDVARNATAAVHLLVGRLTPDSPVSLAVEEGGRAVAAAQWFRLIDVPVEINTGPVGFIEKKDERNEHVTRRAPFRVYDAMEPIGGTVVSAAATMAFRLHIPIAADQSPGQRRLSVRVHHGDDARELTLIVNVYAALVPPVGRDSLPYTNWFSLGNMACRHGLELWSEAHWRMVERYAALMVRGRQNTFLLPWGDIFARTAKEGLVLNRPRLERLVRVFTDAGMHWIEGGHVASRTGGQWLSPTFDVSLGGPMATSREGGADLAKALRQLREAIDANGWKDRWIQHVADEPVKENATEYRILVGMVRKNLPGVPILDATMNTDMAGSVDIWCPQAQEYQRHEALFRAQKALGDRVWFYTCCFPGGPWINRLMDMELLRPALIGWGAARFDLDGFLHWGLNHYGRDQDPFKQSVVPHSDNNHLPAGDTHVVYPGHDGPWSSLRFEAQREGLEDYELLRRLKSGRAEEAARIIGQVLRGFDDYTKDVSAFRAARRSLLEAASR